MAAHKWKCLYNSACIQDICKFSTFLPRFLRSLNPDELFLILCMYVKLSESHEIQDGGSKNVMDVLITQ